jgi:1-acyl-sn-glycerol-3-phosphate acyltransferase
VAELITEGAIWPMYRVHGHGPGLEQMPEGPVVVIANHAAWLDPVWVAKLLPRQMIPMLTSVFFDLGILRWLMGSVAKAIRVEATTFRREIPEIKQAIEVLDRGDALIIFPEGALRKKEEQLIKQFGRGVWHILKERPNTPILMCWIEGGWGSFFSYWKGKPTKNKRLDFWRRIDVAVDVPFVLPPEVLADQRATRQFLMRKCLETRRFLGLESTAAVSADAFDNEEEAAESV